MSDWQSIESAPKDGTPVRLKSPAFSPTELFWWKSGRWETKVLAVARVVHGCWDEDLEQPTHWMPA